MADDPYNGPERRGGFWQGGIDARMVAAERTISELVRSHTAIAGRQIKMEGQLEVLRLEVAEYAAEVEEARKKTVKEMQNSIAETRVETKTARASRVALRWQVALAVAVAFFAPAVATLVTLWVAK